MVKSCVARNCKSRFGDLDRTGQKLQFHGFPLNNAERLKLWIVAVRRERGWQPTKHSVLCSNHFKETDYLVRPGANIRLLSDKCVPSIFKYTSNVKCPKKKRILRKQQAPTSSDEEECFLKQGEAQLISSVTENVSEVQNASRNEVSIAENNSSKEVDESKITRTPRSVRILRKPLRYRDISDEEENATSKRNDNTRTTSPKEISINTSSDVESKVQTALRIDSGHDAIMSVMEIDENETNFDPDILNNLEKDNSNIQTTCTSSEKPKQTEAASQISHCVEVSNKISETQTSFTLRGPKIQNNCRKDSAGVQTLPNLHLYKPQQIFPSKKPPPLSKSVSIQVSIISPVIFRLKRQVKMLQKQLIRRNKKIASLKSVVKESKLKEKRKEKLTEVLKNNFSDEAVQILSNRAKNKSKKKEHKCNETTKSFALTLYFHSQLAYKHVRTVFDCLPHPATIRKWISSFKCEPGFLDEVLESIKQEIRGLSSNDFSLVMDFMPIRKQVKLDKRSNQLAGYVNTGGITTEDETCATKAMFFFIVSLKDNLKCPVAYFLLNRIDPDIQAELLITCVMKLFEVGVNIVNFTCDASQENIRTLNILGCNFEDFDDTVHKSFIIGDQEIFVVFEPRHAVMLARNTLAKKKVINSSLGDIKWSYIVDLVEEQKNSDLKFDKKLSSKHIKFSKKKSNTLALQTLSNSTAHAIEYFMQSGHPKFQGAEATIGFIRNIATIFDSLNTKNPNAEGMGEPLLPDTKVIWEEFFDDSVNFLKSLSIEGKNVLDHHDNLFALAFMVSCASVSQIASKLLLNNDAYKYVLTNKFSQEHLKLFFASLKGKGGWNTNPDCIQLKKALRGVLFRHFVRIDSGKGSAENEQTAELLYQDPNTFCVEIEVSTEGEHMDLESFSNELYNTFDLMDSSQINKQKTMTHISEFIVDNLTKSLSCEYCLKMLLKTGDQEYLKLEHNYCSNTEGNTLIKFNNQGPSDCVLNIVNKAEQFFKIGCFRDLPQVKDSDVIEQAVVYVTSVYRNLQQVPFPNSHPSSNKANSEDTHEAQILRKIVNIYLQMRLSHFKETLSEKKLP